MTNTQSERIAIFSRLLGPDKVVSGDRLALRDPGYCAHAFGGGVLLTPKTTDDVSALCSEANKHGIAIVPQGGLTGLVEATETGPGSVAVSFERMNKVLRIDPLQGIAIVEAGTVLEDLISAAADHNMQPGVDLPSRGTCTLGGMTGTNAGGIQAIRYGMMRDNILGLTAVLASGEVLELNNTLVKNNSGYDLKQMFIGSEGTLGLVTQIVVKLHPIPNRRETTLVGCPDTNSLFTLLTQTRDYFGGQLLSFEVMWPAYYQSTTGQPGFGTPLMNEPHSVYAIVEVGEWNDDASDQSRLTDFLANALERGWISDAVIAQSQAQRMTIWRAREDSDAVAAEHADNLSYDVGLCLADIPEYLQRLNQKITKDYPDVTVYVFGHLGDGNLHVMLGLSETPIQNRSQYDQIVYGTLSEFKGTTISAEHGVGLEKKEYLHLSQSTAALASMKHLKQCFDPNNILNPGKVI